MSIKEFKNLNKAELLEVIYRLQMREQTLHHELLEWKAKASERYEKLSSSGNIAEASLAIHDVFSAAQKAADDYVAAVSEKAEQERRQALALMQRVYTVADSIRDFLGELDGEEMGLDTYRTQIAGILGDIAPYLPDATGD